MQGTHNLSSTRDEVHHAEELLQGLDCEQASESRNCVHLQREWKILGDAMAKKIDGGPAELAPG